MGYDDGGSRIVRTWCGRGTGDSFYQTANGVVWHTVYSTPVRTGASYASVRDGRMVPIADGPLEVHPAGSVPVRPPPDQRQARRRRLRRAGRWGR